MDNFMIGIEHDVVSDSYMACFLDGESVLLNAANYEDAVLEADLLVIDNYELGYN
jgi:hypothetical protein